MENTSIKPLSSPRAVATDWYQWGSWGTCSSTCGEGVRWRRRACLESGQSCPTENQPRGLFYEKVQFKDCSPITCNVTVTDNAMLSTKRVGVSIAISVSIIVGVFILAKSLHCISRRKKSCFKRPVSNFDQNSSSRENLAGPISSTESLSGSVLTVENLANPGFITITQEMISRPRRHGIPISCLAVSENPRPSSLEMSASPADNSAVAQTESERDVDSPDNNSTRAIMRTERDFATIAVFPPRSETVELNPNPVDMIQPGEGGNLSARSSITEQAISADVLKPPPYESLFPTCRRVQTL